MSRVIIYGLSFLIPITFHLQAISEGFDAPIGKPNGDGYSSDPFFGGLDYLQRHKYSCGNVYHPASDINDDDSFQDYLHDANDAGDPVYAAADGIIKYAEKPTDGWGYVILIEHKGLFGLPEGGVATKVWTQYAHLAKIAPRKNSVFPWSPSNKVNKGDLIGYVGDLPHNSGKAFHLHFEIRKEYLTAPSFPCNWTKEKVRSYYTNPSDFIALNRKPFPSLITIDGDPEDWEHINYDPILESDSDYGITRTIFISNDDKYLYFFIQTNFDYGAYHLSLDTDNNTNTPSFSGSGGYDFNVEVSEYNSHGLYMNLPNGSNAESGGLIYSIKIDSSVKYEFALSLESIRELTPFVNTIRIFTESGIYHYKLH